MARLPQHRALLEEGRKGHQEDSGLQLLVVQYLVPVHLLSVRLEHPIPLLLVVEHQVQLLEGVLQFLVEHFLALLPQRVEHSVV